MSKGDRYSGMTSLRTLLIAFGCLVVPLASATAQEDDARADAQANNPLANVTALNIQDYYIGDVTEFDSDANVAFLRYAKPFSFAGGQWLFRGSAPYLTSPTFPNGSTVSGLGDINAFAAYLIDTGNPAVSFGIGPQITAPTATEDDLGSEKWSAGFANVLFNGSSPKFQYGYLLTWQHSFAGDDSRNDVNAGAFQPFAFYQLGDGLYLRAAPIWTYNFQNDDYSLPVGVGIGKVIKRGDTVYNFFVEPQYSVADRGPGQPEWQVYFALNMQFYR